MAAVISVVGLGSGDEDQLSLGIWKKLQAAQTVYLRTDKHPVVRMLIRNGISFHTFDDVYEQEESFPQVYEVISNRLVEMAQQETGEIVYAVPGHPMVAESTVQLLQERCKEKEITLNVLGGESFLDQAFLRLGFDPIEGFQLLDGSRFHPSHLHPQLHTVIAQVYDTHTASDAKLALMEVYPDDHPVVIAHALGVKGEEWLKTVPLYELDRDANYGNLTLIWVPRSDRPELQSRYFSRLQEIVTILRSPEGCPWDREQTHASLRKNLIEETYEVLETIDDNDPVAMCEELGDLLLQVMLHSQIEEEGGIFNVGDVIAALNEKLIRRHPHVFGDRSADNAEEALDNWQEMKRVEKRAKGLDVGQESVLSGIPRDLPVLMKALKLQKKAAKAGFDWEHIEDVFAKVEEELAELREVASSAGNERQRKEELGDLIFAVVNLARFLDVDPEEAAALTNRKFVKRFSHIERQLRLKNKNFDQTDVMEMERLWQEAKQLP